MKNHEQLKNSANFSFANRIDSLVTSNEVSNLLSEASRNLSEMGLSRIVLFDWQFGDKENITRLAGFRLDFTKADSWTVRTSAWEPSIGTYYTADGERYNRTILGPSISTISAMYYEVPESKEIPGIYFNTVSINYMGFVDAQDRLTPDMFKTGVVKSNHILDKLMGIENDPSLIIPDGVRTGEVIANLQNSETRVNLLTSRLNFFINSLKKS